MMIPFCFAMAAAMVFIALAAREERLRRKAEAELENAKAMLKSEDRRVLDLENKLADRGRDLEYAEKKKLDAEALRDKAEARYRGLVSGIKDLLLEGGISATEAIAVGLAAGEARKIGEPPRTIPVPTGRGGTLGDIAKRAMGKQ